MQGKVMYEYNCCLVTQTLVITGPGLTIPPKQQRTGLYCEVEEQPRSHEHSYSGCVQSSLMLICTDHWTVTIFLEWMIPEYFAFCIITPSTSHTSSLLFFTQHSQNALYSQPFWKRTVMAKAFYISVRHTGNIQLFLCQCTHFSLHFFSYHRRWKWSHRSGHHHLPPPHSHTGQRALLPLQERKAALWTVGKAGFVCFSLWKNTLCEYNKISIINKLFKINTKILYKKY